MRVCVSVVFLVACWLSGVGFGAAGQTELICAGLKVNTCEAPQT